MGLDGFDLSGAVLRSFRFFGTTISNCRFDQADCRDWRLWDCDVADSSFVGADLREAALGGTRGAATPGDGNG